MTLMMFLSHGTQDLYPDFLKTAHGFAPSVVAYVAILYNIGAILGAILFGPLSLPPLRSPYWAPPTSFPPNKLTSHKPPPIQK